MTSPFEFVGEYPERSGDIRISPRDGEALAPELLSLVAELDTALAVVRTASDRDGTPEEYRRYFDKLLAATQACLGGQTVLADAMRASIDAWKAEAVATFGPRVKNRYWLDLLRSAAVAAGTLVALSVVVVVVEWILASRGWFIQTDAVYYLCLLAGACGGVWLSYGARNQLLTFEQLRNPEADLVRPPLRLGYVGLLTLILGLGIARQMVDMRVGSLSSSDFTSDVGTALLLGLLCGFSEQTLAPAVTERARLLVSQFAGKNDGASNPANR